MGTEYVMGYSDNSGGSHMFALWTGQTAPDEDDVDGWAWIMADKVTRIFRRFDSEWAAVVTVVCMVEDVVLTFAPMEDVRWGVDLALNGGKHRTLPALNLSNATTTEAYQAATLAGFRAAEAVFKRERDGE